MKILDDVQNIFNKHTFDKITFPDSGYENVYEYLNDFPDDKKHFQSKYNDWMLRQEFKEHIPKGWYGFDIGTPINPIWVDIIREIVLTCIKADPNFEIHQIKLKYGGICFYCYSNVIEDLHDVEILIMKKLFDKALIY